MIYEIHDKVLQVVVVTVGHRREEYRGSLGGQPDDLQPFDAKQFAQALFEE